MLTRDDHVYLKQLQEIFHNSINKLDKNYIISNLSNNIPPNLSNDKGNNKQDRSVYVTEKYSDTELEPVQQNTKRIRNHQVGNLNFELYAPQHIHVSSIYAHKQLHTKLFEHEEDKNTMSKRIKKL